MRRILFAHGLEGSPEGRKATALRQARYAVTAPDGRGKNLAERLEDLQTTLLTMRPGAVLLGSSYGGLAALYLAQEHPGRLRGLLLCAPALTRSEPPVDDPTALQVPAELPTTLLHGIHDEVIPIEHSRELARRHPHIKLIELDDDHSLAQSIDVLIREADLLAGW